MRGSPRGSRLTTATKELVNPFDVIVVGVRLNEVGKNR